MDKVTAGGFVFINGVEITTSCLSMKSRRASRQKRSLYPGPAIRGSFYLRYEGSQAQQRGFLLSARDYPLAVGRVSQNCARISSPRSGRRGFQPAMQLGLRFAG
jgi:hypothetical protein